ncbi:MAG: GTPase [Clostridiales bacterium]|jgi:GTP-binding protein HflX|nr:GTPase [Clostridiales bacterium]
MTESDNIRQRAILVGLFQGLKDEMDIDESMKELSELTLAAGAEVVDTMIQNKAKIEAATYIGTGKVEEVRLAIEFTDANLVIFNDELSGAQIRNLESELEVRVIDRTTLILDIFAVRAKTKIAKLQVELAQLKYRLPRLIGMGTALSRTGGGIGTRGPGEQKLEIDRRRIQERIDDIRHQIQEAEKNRSVQRHLREKREIPVVALVGYTNAGKSSVMNRLIRMSANADEEKEVFEKDMLFATLDTFNRRIELENKKTFVLTDTVGFVSKLPHSLVSAFRATLDEALGADLLLHIVDISSDSYEMQMRVTGQVINELNAEHAPIITVYNKMDKMTPDMFRIYDPDGVKISAKTGENFEDLVRRVEQELFSDRVQATFLIPYAEGRILSYLCETYQPQKIDHQEDGTLIEVEVSESDFNKYDSYRKRIL